MKILGLTGSIGMGKTTAANQLRQLGLPVFDADAAVADLYADPAAILEIRKILPQNLAAHDFNRALMARAISEYPQLLPQLEKILHPLVRRKEADFLNAHRAAGTPIVVLDIPLLLESADYRRCDFIAVVTAPRLLQIWRVMRRPGMTWRKFLKLSGRQMPDRDKRRLADFVVNTAWGKSHSRKRWQEIISAIG